MPETKYMDKHHVSRHPPKTVLTPHRDHQKIHNKVPIIDELTLKMRQYEKIIQLSVMLKNWKHSFNREFGVSPINISMEQLGAEKKKILREVELLIRNQLQLLKVPHIMGIGTCSLAELLAFAHPERFPTLNRYLFYCGYTKASKITKRYNRKVCGLIFRITNQLIRENPKYYALYRKIKEEQPADFSKIRKHRVAMNRVATLFLKEFYCLFKRKEMKTFYS
jgi:hypothetical protein